MKIKGFLSSIAAPLFAGMLSGNVVLHGYSLFTTGQIAHGDLQSPDLIAAPFASIIAAGLAGYLLGKRNSAPVGRPAPSNPLTHQAPNKPRDFAPPNP
mgnify:FL=1